MKEWYESRSFLEVKKSITLLKEIEVTDEATAAIASLLSKTMETEKNRELILECMAMLINLSGKCDWLATSITTAGKESFIWGDRENFEILAGNFAGRLLPHLMRLTLEVKGEEWFVDFAIELPFRLWKTTTKVLKDSECGEDLLISRVEDKFSKKKANCDQLLWIWKSKLKNKEDFITHTNLFTIVSRTTNKHFLKAQRQLLDLIADNDKFLKFLLGDGDAKKIKSFMEHLRTYSNRAGIDEKKMLLRIAELFPKAQKNIEKTTVKKKTAAESIDMLVTSKSSYSDYRQKLKEVLEELPENKKQIQRAREFGDFSENSELDAANERRDYLLARQTELTEALEKVVAVDFSEMKIDGVVALGASVTVTVAKENTTYHLLGCWDSRPEDKILSSGSDLTKVLIGQKEGAKVTLPNGKKAEITKVASLDKKIAKMVNTVK